MRKTALLAQHFENHEFRQSFVEWKSSQATLDNLLEKCRNVVFEVKNSFENIKAHENETEVMREKYFNMLTEQKIYKEADRDAYFHKEQVAKDAKDMYIAESQSVIYRCAQYLTNSENVSKQRDAVMLATLKDADKMYMECRAMKHDGERQRKQCAELETKVQVCESTIRRMADEITTIRQEKSSLEEAYKSCDKDKNQVSEAKHKLEEKYNSLATTATDSENHNQYLTVKLHQRTDESAKLGEKLTDTEKQLTLRNEEIQRGRKYQEKLRDEIECHKQNIEKLTKEKHNLIEKCRLSNVQLRKYREDIELLRRQNDNCQETIQQTMSERDSLHEVYEKTKKESDENKEKCISAQRKRDFLRRDKNRLLLQQHHTRQRNEILVGDHRFLINVVEELKMNYRKADNRTKKDSQLKQDLRDTVKRLHKELEEEKIRKQKITSDVRIQTDPSLACESNDIAIQHARFKMMQALRARDQLAKERNKEKPPGRSACSSTVKPKSPA